MHELGILNHVVRTVDRIAKENGIEKIDHITLEVGEASGCVPAFLEKLFPIAIEKQPKMQKRRKQQKQRLKAQKQQPKMQRKQQQMQKAGKQATQKQKQRLKRLQTLCNERICTQQILTKIFFCTICLLDSTQRSKFARLRWLQQKQKQT